MSQSWDEHVAKHVAIGTDPSGKFVFEWLTNEKLEEMAGADDNICFLGEEDFERLVKEIITDYERA